MRRAPRFWDNPPAAPGWQTRLLWPAAKLWHCAAKLRAALVRPYHCPVPVICVGNLTAGGAGKTPMVAALASRYAGHAPHVVSRGHGGRLTGPHRVDPSRDTAADVGDEPLLLTRHAPVWIARRRPQGLAAATDAGAGLILMDDGMQNPTVAKIHIILMVDAGQAFGNGCVIPAGPLREPVARGLARSDLVVLLGAAEARAEALETWPALRDRPLVDGDISPTLTPPNDIPYLAFAGIGRPQKFFDSLAVLGLDIVATREFADHHPYGHGDIAQLRHDAAALGATLITTEKDLVRLSTQDRQGIATLPVGLHLSDWSAVDRLIQATDR